MDYGIDRRGFNSTVTNCCECFEQGSTFYSKANRFYHCFKHHETCFETQTQRNRQHLCLKIRVVHMHAQPSMQWPWQYLNPMACFTIVRFSWSYCTSNLPKNTSFAPAMIAIKFQYASPLSKRVFNLHVVLKTSFVYADLIQTGVNCVFLVPKLSKKLIFCAM